MIDARMAYLATWVTLLVGAVIAVATRPEAFEWTRRPWWRFHLEPWKPITFALATAVIAAAAPYSGDPTWDLGDSLLVSCVVFLTSPWAVGAIYRELLGVQGRSWRRLYVAMVAFWLPCWTYDAYILLRDGIYPPTWWSNLGLSGPICLLAGLLWNLGAQPDQPGYFTFRWARWPPATPTPFRRVLGLALLLMVPVGLAVAAFIASFLLDGAL